MNDLAELQRRKAELKNQIEQQRDGLKQTFHEIREEVEPANLLKKVVSGAFDFSKKGKDGERPNILERFSIPLAVAGYLFGKNPKIALALKVLGPVAQRFFPNKVAPSTSGAEEKKGNSIKTTIYGGLRRGISALRGRLPKRTGKAERNPHPPEN